jgi:hypothetical protein
VCCRQIDYFDIKDKKLYVRTKNQTVKIKIIPEILFKDLPNLSSMNKGEFVFILDKFEGDWAAT